MLEIFTGKVYGTNTPILLDTEAALNLLSREFFCKAGAQARGYDSQYLSCRQTNNKNRWNLARCTGYSFWGSEVYPFSGCGESDSHLDDRNTYASKNESSYQPQKGFRQDVIRRRRGSDCNEFRIQGER